MNRQPIEFVLLFLLFVYLGRVARTINLFRSLIFYVDGGGGGS